MLPILIFIILIGIVGAVAFLKTTDDIESGEGLKASDFEITEIREK